ncbi:hypothetical protein L1887_17133 [Cichorium endivia]|nr:hypothetical protein L1887_17133 [Cichorium endivia]
MGTGNGLTLISDQHKGLVEAVKERAPDAEHRQCARHIYANFKKRFKGEQFRKLFWIAAKSTTEEKFKAVMKEINQISVLAHEHLIEREPKTWSKAYFKVLGSDTSWQCLGPVTGTSRSMDPHVEDPLFESAPVEAATVESATVEAATVESATVEAATVESATVEAATVEAATADEDPQEDVSNVTASQVIRKIKKQASERITKLALRRNVGGVGSSADKALSLD